MLQHLRVLEGIGFVESDDGLDVPFRRRSWRAVPGGIRLGDLSGDEDYVKEAIAWLKVAILTQAQVLGDWVEVSPGWPVEWRRSVEQWDHVMRALDESQLRELGEDLHAVTEKWRKVSIEQEGQARPADRAVYVVTHAVPYPQPWPKDPARS